MAANIVTFLGNGLIGPFELRSPVAWRDELPEQDWHRAYFCPKCGYIWARWEAEGAQWWRPVTRACPNHRYYDNERPGSLMEGVVSELYRLPPELLVRELFLGDSMQHEIQGLDPEEIAKISRWGQGSNEAFTDPLA